MAQHREWSYPGSRGTLVARSWGEVGGQRPHIVLISHGYGEHIGRYEWVADQFVRNGAVVYAVDHMGHGKSGGERVLITDFEDVVSDLHRLDEVARGEYPGLPVVLLGHSMGGLIAARYAQAYGDTLAAVVLSSPVIGRWDILPVLLAMDEIPDVPLDVSTLSSDPEVGARYAADPLIWHGPFKRPTLEALDRTLKSINGGPSLGDLPLMWIHGDGDALVPIDGSRSGVHQIRGNRFVERIYLGRRHELFNEVNADEVIADVLEFIRNSLAPR